MDEPLSRDPSAFFDDVYPAVRRFVSGATGSPAAEVEELVQDILYQAWRDRAQFRGDASPTTWVISIARNTILRRRRSVRREERWEAARRALASMETELIPDRVLGTAEMGQAVRGALSRIDSSYAEVLITHYCEGRSIREIAKAAGETEKAIESRIHRAREALRTELNAGESP